MEELHEIQSKLIAPKKQRNSFGNYNYRSCEDILEALKPLLYAHGCSLILDDKIVQIGDRIYVEATAKLENSGGIVVQTSAYAREEDDKKGMASAQLTGATSSYARKYALNGLFCIDDTRDADATNKHGKDDPVNTPKPKPPVVIDKLMTDECVAYIQECKSPQEALEKISINYVVSQKAEQVIRDLWGKEV